MCAYVYLLPPIIYFVCVKSQTCKWLDAFSFGGWLGEVTKCVLHKHSTDYDCCSNLDAQTIERG